jgi:hypothetical protein
MILLIRDLLDTPLHVYKPLKLHQIGINQFVILLFAHSISLLSLYKLTGEIAPCAAL